MAETQNTGQFAKTIVTDVGKDMIAKSQNGQTLTFSRVALGDGLVGEEDVTKFTAVKNERLSLPIAKYSNLGNGQFQIQFRLTNSQVESGFWHREIGIMAKIDNGQEQLYAYTTAGNKASFIYDKTTPVEERIVNVNFVIGNAQNLEVIINSSVIYATIEDLEEALDAHDAGDDAHEAAFAAHNADGNAHKDMVGATSGVAGKRGMVPAPAAGDQNKALFGDATYKQVVQKVNGVVADSAGNVLVNSLAQTDIPENADLNNYTESGFYRCMYSTIVSTVLNKPETTGAFYMQVVRGGTTTQRYQILYNIGTNTLWTRGNISGAAWTDWVKLVKATDVIPIPIGTILPFAGGTIPSGFLACNGAAVSRTTYAALYSAIGTTYGTGNGSTTFNVPAVEDNRFLEFSTTRGNKRNAGLPNITGEFDVRRGYNQYGADDGTLQGAFVFDSSDNAFTGVSTQTNDAQNVDYGINVVGTTRVTFSAANANSIYGASTTVQPKSLTVRAIIKY